MHVSFFTEYLSPHKKAFTIVGAFMILESVLSLSIPFVIGQFASSVLQEPSERGILTTNIDWPYSYFITIWLLLILLQTVTRYQVSFKVNMVGARILKVLSCRLYDHIQMLPLDYFSQRKKGEVLSLISNDANVISHFMSGVITSLIPSILVASGALLLMASINPTLAMMIALSVPAFFILLKLLGRKLRPLSEQVTAQQANIVSIAAENFSSIKLIKSFSQENLESKKFQQSALSMLNLRQSQFQLQALISPLLQMLISVGIVGIVLLSALHYRAGEISISELITLLMYGLLFARPMSNLAGVYGQLQQAIGASGRIIEVFEQAPEPFIAAKQDLAFKKGDIQLCELSFSYQSDSILINKVNAHFKPASVNLIVGKNGSGKTSLLNLLMRFMSPQNGHILIDEQDIRESSLPSLRQHLGLVSQDVALSYGSVIDNICYGLGISDKTDVFELVVDAAKKAGAHAFIEKLPKGYDTQVGDNGVLLSGGQRQRISLARTLLLNQQVIMFDEPTSFADSQGKKEFAELLRGALAEHTVIIVSHDNELRELASQVFELVDGTIKVSHTS
jgi:ABC-type multidrug transport system fused ATPase/permease subunit